MAQNPAPNLPPERPPVSGFTARAFAVGTLSALAIGLGCSYATFALRGSYMDLDFSTPGAVFLFFVLTAGVNTLLRRFRPRWALTPPELILVYSMMVVASAIPTMGLTAQLLPIITAPFYFASAENNWASLIQPHIQPWLHPHGDRVIKGFYEGMKSGEHIPWGAWATPLLLWLPFVFALYVVMICFMALWRRQWVEHERLIFPLTHLPLEMVKTDAHPLNPLFRNKLLWAGFALPFIFGSFTGLHYYYPVVPAPTLSGRATVPWLRGDIGLPVRLSFPMLGFFYLVNTDCLFSLWVFNLLAQFARATLNAFDVGMKENLGIYGSPYAIYNHLGFGAMLFLVLNGAWVGREHLKKIWRKVLFNDKNVDDSQEILSYRTAFFGAIAGLLFMAVWLWLSGITWWLVPLFLLAVFVLFIGLTRVVVESGLAEAVATTTAPSVIVSALGTQVVGVPALTALGLTYVWCSDIRTFVMASAANSLKMADVVCSQARNEVECRCNATSLRCGRPDGSGRADYEPSRRPLFGAMLLACVVALASSISLTLYLSYTRGGLTLNDWFFKAGPVCPYNYVVDKINNPHGPRWDGLAVAGLGAGIMALLNAMRMRFLWFPFHPIGFCIGSVWIMDQLWLTTLTAWTFKVLILRYGGSKSFRTLRPLFLGLILGQFTCSGTWLVIDWLTGHQGNTIFWI